jgi:uncharacterized membrane protein YedE/YeeE
MKRYTLAALIAGALFGVGLALSGMTDARRVLGFLDVAGAFDPTLLFVLGGAVVTTTLLFHVVLRRDKPLLADTFHVSTLRQIDRPLVVGAALFGIGWGLAGYCPGPALAGLGVASREALWFVPAMIVGMFLHGLWEQSLGRLAQSHEK